MQVKNKRQAVLFLAALLLLFAASVLSLRFGSTHLNTEQFFGGLLRREGLQTQSVIIYTVRLPRMLSGILAGVGLALSGTLLQSVTGNALASPNVLGVNSGAGFFVILSLTFFPTLFVLLPVFAFFGAIVAAFSVVGIAGKNGADKSTVVLSGVALSALFSAGISFLSVLDSDVLSSYNDFSVGGLSGVMPKDLYAPAVIIAVCFCAALFLSRDIKLFCLGDSLAASLGVNVKRVRTLAVFIAAALAASVVSFAGLIGFVGLIVPHVARRLCKNDLLCEMWLSPMLGASLVLLADLLGRTLFAPSEVSVGIFTAILGVPFFLYLVIRRKKNA